MRKNLTLFLVFLLSGNCFCLYGQSVYVNTPNAIFELTGGIGSCSTASLVNQCAPDPEGVLSLALYKDTIYYVTVNGQLKRFKVGSAGTCESLRYIGPYNSMTIDKSGTLYFSDNVLLKYNPYTNELVNLGSLPFSSAGDLFFFNNKLLLAGSPPGIYEININDPANSTLYMNTNGIRFFGLISFPESCNRIRYYGLAPNGGSTSLIELDLVNKVLTGTICSIPLNVYDAASVTESGFNEGIIVTSFTKTHPCPPATTGAIAITAVPTVPGNLSYTLDNTVTNTSGIFSGISTGNHSIRIISDDGCIKDTSFRISAGLGSTVGLQKTNPDNCDNNNGTVSITAASDHTPITYTLLNAGNSQSSGNFADLMAGVYAFKLLTLSGAQAILLWY
ncbi:MAG: hypothetical protein WDO16_13850 [Bacteroidota bacterium]